MKSDIVQVFASLEKIAKIDFDDFYYKLSTGRLLNDGKICELVNSNLNELLSNARNYHTNYQSMIQNTSLTELQDRNYINRESRKVAKQIAEYYNNNIWNLE